MTESCASCGHTHANHPEGGPCRLTRCPCVAWTTVPVPPDPEQRGPQRVCIDVPPGYMFTVSLVPYTERPEEPSNGS